MKLETKRLIIRSFEKEDAAAFALLVADPDVMHFSLNGPMNASQALNYFQNRILDHHHLHGYGLNAVIHKEANTLIGYAGILQQEIEGKCYPELGYRLYPRYQGFGYAKEACLAVINHAFDIIKQEELISIIDPKNLPSLKLARSLGMHYWKDAVYHNIPVEVYRMQKEQSNLLIRVLREEDIPKLGKTFAAPWSPEEATIKQWQEYYQEQEAGKRTAFLLMQGSNYLGYGSLLRESAHPYFLSHSIPEINALWIGDKYRNRGLATKLIAHLEEMAKQEGYKTVGLGVGLYKDYGPAQKLYFKLGYSPDGTGVTYKNVSVVPGATHPVDDDLLIWLTKPL